MPAKEKSTLSEWFFFNSPITFPISFKDEAFILLIISSLGASSIKDMGKVMGELKKKYADTIDFAKAGKILKDLLNK